MGGTYSNRQVHNETSEGGSSSPLLDVISTRPKAAILYHRPRSGRSTSLGSKKYTGCCTDRLSRSAALIFEQRHYARPSEGSDSREKSGHPRREDDQCTPPCIFWNRARWI